MKNILLTGGRSPIALELARQLHAAGHRISIADTSPWHVTRFSNAVSQTFVIPSPRFAQTQFIDSLVSITKNHHIDLVIPIYEEILPLAKHKDLFPSHCQVFCSPFETVRGLHDKWTFDQRLKTHGFLTPHTTLIKNHHDLKQLHIDKPYALKATYSRASQSIYKIVPGQPLPSIEIEPQNPWIAQEWLEGDRYCTYSVCQQGSVLAHGVYPVRFAINGTSCYTFEAIDHPGILKWVQDLVRCENFTGQIAFDFIETSKGLYAIECNPRATSGAHLFKHEDRLDLAFFNRAQAPIYPKVGNQKQIAIATLMYGWKKKHVNRDAKTEPFLKKLLSTRDVIFTRRDIKPFLSQGLIFPLYCLKSIKLKRNLSDMFTYDLAWNGE